jgi:hypothetical protein
MENMLYNERLIGASVMIAIWNGIEVGKEKAQRLRRGENDINNMQEQIT